jgi:hypothetical protein
MENTWRDIQIDERKTVEIPDYLMDTLIEALNALISNYYRGPGNVPDEAKDWVVEMIEHIQSGQRTITMLANQFNAMPGNRATLLEIEEQLS